ncbi:MAG TPA: hypothetical protein VH914_01600 [Acidimicrobiia bacterium]|nr:hypothetical protein [Acidimicrobiia bacterium]
MRRFMVAIVIVGACAGIGVRSADAAVGSISLNGSPVTVTLTKSGDYGIYTFSGTAGTRVFAELTSSTFGPDCPAVALSLYYQDFTKLGSTATTCGSTAVLETRTLTNTGTWGFLVDPQQNDIGSATLRAWSVPADQSAPITLDAPATAVSLGTPGQNGAFTFTPTVGQPVSAALTGAAFSGACPTVALSFVRPDGSQAATTSTCTSTASLNAIPIDQAGTWTARVDPQLDSTGSAALQVLDNTDQHAPLILNGGAVDVELARDGQNGIYSFAGTAGQKVSATVAAATFPGCPAYTLALVRPDGTTLGTPVGQCGDTGFLDGQLLDQTGTWSLRVDPQGSATGSAQLTAYDATDQVRSIKINGPGVSANLLKPGQNSLLQFDGTTGTTITAQVTGATFSGSCPTFAFSLVRPDGTTLGSPVTGCTDTTQLAAQTLDQTGTWSFRVDAQGPATGTATVQAFVATNDVRAIALNGARLGLHLNAVQSGDYTFTGTAGQNVSAAVSNASFAGGCPGYTLALVRPDGTTLGAPVDGCDADAFLDALVLDQDGTWTFVVQPVGTTLDASIQAYTFNELTKPTASTGKSLKVIVKRPGQNATLTFSGTAGQRISAVVSSSLTGGACPGVALTLVRPDGTNSVAVPSTCADGAFLDAVTLDATGTWQLAIDPQGASDGTVRAQIYTVVDDVRTIAPSGTPKSFTAQQPGANGHFHFKGSAGQVRTVTVSWSTFTGCPGVVVSLVRPDGSVLASVDGCDANFVLGPATLDAKGKFTVIVDPQGPVEGTMIVKLTG